VQVRVAGLSDDDLSAPELDLVVQVLPHGLALVLGLLVAET
jgi:hypothetical protein